MIAIGAITGKASSSSIGVATVTRLVLLVDVLRSLQVESRIEPSLPLGLRGRVDECDGESS